jgi:hypothetical protein
LLDDLLGQVLAKGTVQIPLMWHPLWRGGRSESIGRADFSRRPPWFASKRECLGVIAQGYLKFRKYHHIFTSYF